MNPPSINPETAPQQQYSERVPLLVNEEAPQTARGRPTKANAGKSDSQQPGQSTEPRLPDRETIASEFIDVIWGQKYKRLPPQRLPKAIDEYIERATQSPNLNSTAARENFIKWWFAKERKTTTGLVPLETNSAADTKERIAQSRFNRELATNFIRLTAEVQADKPLSDNLYEYLAGVYLEQNTGSAENHIAMEKFCKEHLEFLKLIDEKYEAKYPGKTLSPEQRCFYLQSARIIMRGFHLEAEESHIQEFLEYMAEGEPIFNQFNEYQATLNSQDVVTMHRLVNRRIDKLENTDFKNKIAALYLEAASRYAALPEAPLEEDTGGGRHVIVEKDFQTIVNTAHDEWSQQVSNSAQPFYRYFESELCQKRNELETRIAFFLLKGEFPVKATVDMLTSKAEMKMNGASNFAITFSQAVEQTIATSAMENCLIPKKAGKSSFNSSKVVNTTLSIGVGGRVNDYRRANIGARILILKIDLARIYGDEIQIDVDAWAREYREKEQLYETVIDQFPNAIKNVFELHPVWPGKKKNESLYHIERCVIRIRTEHPSLENLKQLDEDQKKLVLTAVKNYCSEQKLDTA